MSIVWAMVPMCMVPTAQTVREQKYVTTAGIVKFAVGESGRMEFVAAIATSLPAGRYVLRAKLERDDPDEPNREPSLLGTNIQLRRRPLTGEGVGNILVIRQGLPVLGGNGHYVVDSPGRDLNDGISIETHFYWVELELQQATPATAETRNSVIGLELHFRP